MAENFYMNLPYGVEGKRFQKGMCVVNLAKKDQAEKDNIIKTGFADGSLWLSRGIKARKFELCGEFKTIYTHPEGEDGIKCPEVKAFLELEKYFPVEKIENVCQLNNSFSNSQYIDGGWLYSGGTTQLFYLFDIPASFLQKEIKTLGDFLNIFATNNFMLKTITKGEDLGKDNLLSSIVGMSNRNFSFKRGHMEPYIRALLEKYKDLTFEEAKTIPCTWSQKHYTSGGGGRDMFLYHYDTTIEVEGVEVLYKYKN